MNESNPNVTPEIPGTLRAAVIGGLMGMVLAFAGVGGALYVGGRGSAIALGLGGMAAFWGGLGFGAMLGGTLHLVRHTEEPHQPAAVQPHRTDASIDALVPRADGHDPRPTPTARPSSEVA